MVAAAPGLPPLFVLAVRGLESRVTGGQRIPPSGIPPESGVQEGTRPLSVRIKAPRSGVPGDGGLTSETVVCAVGKQHPLCDSCVFPARLFAGSRSRVYESLLLQECVFRSREEAPRTRDIQSGGVSVSESCPQPGTYRLRHPGGPPNAGHTDADPGSLPARFVETVPHDGHCLCDIGNRSGS
jgi:hypothetical protein